MKTPYITVDRVRMTRLMQQRHTQSKNGFTLIEMMIVVAIIGILAAIAFPSYQGYVKKVKRSDMMIELQNIGKNITSQKIAQGGYTAMTWSTINGTQTQYPYTGDALYNLTVTNLTTGKWLLTATPVMTRQMTTDGILTLSYTGQKCHQTKCGFEDEWRK